MQCPHRYLDVHLVGDSTVIACTVCLRVLDHDVPTYTKQ